MAEGTKSKAYPRVTWRTTQKREKVRGKGGERGYALSERKRKKKWRAFSVPKGISDCFKDDHLGTHRDGGKDKVMGRRRKQKEKKKKRKKKRKEKKKKKKKKGKKREKKKEKEKEKERYKRPDTSSCTDV